MGWSEKRVHWYVGRLGVADPREWKSGRTRDWRTVVGTVALHALPRMRKHCVKLAVGVGGVCVGGGEG